MRQGRFDFSLLAIATLLVVQATVASYGIRLIRDSAGRTHAALVAVATAR
jgi:hypothetical protein